MGIRRYLLKKKHYNEGKLPSSSVSQVNRKSEWNKTQLSQSAVNALDSPSSTANVIQETDVPLGPEPSARARGLPLLP